MIANQFTSMLREMQGLEKINFIIFKKMSFELSDEGNCIVLNNFVEISKHKVSQSFLQIGHINKDRRKTVDYRS